MSDTSTSTTTTRPRRARWLLPVLVVVLAAAGIGVGLAWADEDDDLSPAVPLGNMQEACENWMDSYTGTAPASGWCRAMTAWMYEQGADGRMTGSMMWGDADNLRDACRQWAIAEPSAAGSAMDTAQWCDDMVAWMRQHMGEDWDDWMMDDSMMSR